MEEMWLEYREQLESLGISPLGLLAVLLWDGRYALLTAVLDVYSVCSKHDVPLIADGGIKYSGDISNAIKIQNDVSQGLSSAIISENLTEHGK